MFLVILGYYEVLNTILTFFVPDKLVKVLVQ